MGLTILPFLDFRHSKERWNGGCINQISRSKLKNKCIRDFILQGPPHTHSHKNHKTKHKSLQCFVFLKEISLGLKYLLWQIPFSEAWAEKKKVLTVLSLRAQLTTSPIPHPPTRMSKNHFKILLAWYCDFLLACLLNYFYRHRLVSSRLEYFLYISGILSHREARKHPVRAIF